MDFAVSKLPLLLASCPKSGLFSISRSVSKIRRQGTLQKLTCPVLVLFLSLTCPVLDLSGTCPVLVLDLSGTCP